MRKIVLGLLSALLSTPAVADLQENIRSVNNQIGVQVQNRNVDYSETIEGSYGSLLDTESGYVPGYGLSGSLMRNLWLGNDYMEGQYSSFNGNTHYVGGTIINPVYGSVVTYSSAKIVDFNLRYGKGIALDDGFIRLMLTPYAEVGHHRWNRGIGNGSPGGYPEIYSHKYYGIGLLSQSAVENNLIVSLNVLMGKTFGSHIEAGAPAPVTLSTNLGNSALFKAGISFDYAFTRHFHANAGIDYADWQYGESQMISGYYEPDSKTEDVTTKIGVGFSF